MICDLSSVLNNDGAELKIRGNVDVSEETDAFFATFPDGVNVNGSIVCRDHVLELNAHVDGVFNTCCARCLKKLELPLEFDFSETLTQDSEEITDRDSVIVFEGTAVDLSEIVIGNILLNLSYKYLCSEDCRGICPKCGTDLNQKQCSCTEDEIDPRWEELKNFMR